MNSKGTLLPCGRLVPAGPKHGFSDFEPLKKKLDQYSAEKQLNRSEAREKILETLLNEARHFRALDLLERLNRRYPEVGRATLYPNLPVFVESGILKEGPMDAEGQILYELSDDDAHTKHGGDHHDHIVCLDCKRIFEFHDDIIEARQLQVSQQMGFSAKKHIHVVYASCEYKHKNS